MNLKDIEKIRFNIRWYTVLQCWLIWRDGVEGVWWCRPAQLMTCSLCKGEGWRCEKHPEREWPHDDCPGPGEPCQCNPDGKMPPGTTVIWDSERGYLN